MTGPTNAMEDDPASDLLSHTASLVSRFRYTTHLLGATYLLDLARSAVRMDLTLCAPYVMSVGHTWRRIACGDIDYTSILDRTDDALRRLTGDALDSRLSLIASDRGACISSYARLGGDRFTRGDLALLRAALPTGFQARHRTYE
jgi:hypothetical protein